MQAHLDGVVGGRRRHPDLQSQQQKWQPWELWLRQDHVWRNGGDERVLSDGGVDVEVDGEAGGLADGVAVDVAEGVVDGEDLTVGESVLVQRGIQY